MKGFKALSAVRRDAWFIEPGFVHSHLDMLSTFLESNFQSQDKESPSGQKMSGAGIIFIAGPLFKYDGFCGEPGYLSYAQQLQEFEADDSIDRIIISIDTPGGQGSGLRQLASEIRESKKTTIAWVNDSCCSAGYWLASQCNFIYCSQTTDTVGSIGAFCILTNYLKAAETAGKPLIEVYSSLSTEKNLSVREALKGNTELLAAELDEMVEVFIADVKSGRGERLNMEAGDPFKGACFKAEDALKMGLIDGIETLANVITDPKLSKNSNMKYPKLTSLSTMAANSVTPEFLEEVNAELTEAGVTEFSVIPQSFVNDAAAVTEQLTAANATIAAHAATIAEREAELATVNAAAEASAATVAQLTTRVDELESKIPGGNGKKPESKGDIKTDGTAPEVNSWDAKAAKKFNTHN